MVRQQTKLPSAYSSHAGVAFVTQIVVGKLQHLLCHIRVSALTEQFKSAFKWVDNFMTMG